MEIQSVLNGRISKKDSYSCVALAGRITYLLLDRFIYIYSRLSVYDRQSRSVSLYPPPN